MSKTNPMFESAMVDIPKVSGHDMSHEHLTSIGTGKLNPTLCMELIPDSTVSVGNLTNVQLPPFATQFNGKIDLKTELFFVPYRILWGGWKNFISRKNQTDAEGTVPETVPSMAMSYAYRYNPQLFDDTLASQLGYSFSTTEGNTDISSIMPILAYHMIWDKWYRDVRLQRGAFNETERTDYGSYLGTIPYRKDSYQVNDPTANDELFFDGSPLFMPRYRNYGKDYFTTAVPEAVQEGVEHFVSISATKNNFSVSQLRSANAMQKYAEKLAVVGDRYEDIVAATFGVRPSDAVMDKPILLGSSSKPLYSVGSKVTNEKPTGSSVQNPYKDYAGAEIGKIGATDGGSLCGKFTTTEYGILMCIQSVVPHAYYEGVCLDETNHITFTQFANPAFAGLGNVPIYTNKLLSYLHCSSGNGVFGFGDPYAEYKFRNDRVTGQMMTNGTLSPFALKRRFDEEDITIGSDFLTVDPDCLDGVLSWHKDHKRVNSYTGADNPTGWTGYDPSNEKQNEYECDCYWSIKVVNPLPTFVIPSLEPIKGENRFVPKQGTRL